MTCSLECDPGTCISTAQCPSCEVGYYNPYPKEDGCQPCGTGYYAGNPVPFFPPPPPFVINVVVVARMKRIFSYYTRTTISFFPTFPPNCQYHPNVLFILPSPKLPYPLHTISLPSLPNNHLPSFSSFFSKQIVDGERKEKERVEKWRWGEKKK